MRIWPWTALAQAKKERERAEILKTQAESAMAKAGNLWQETREDLVTIDGQLAAADYRLKRAEGESWAEYMHRRGKILSDGRQAPLTLVILDRLDGKTRDAFRDWLAAADPAVAERLRQRASALADFRSELVAALYATSPAEKRAEAHRRGQEHQRIYLDNRQAQEIGRQA